MKRTIALLLALVMMLSMAVPGFAAEEAGDGAGMPPEVTEEPVPTAEPAAEPTEPTAEPTEPTAEPTEPTAEPTEPTAEPAEPTAEPAEPTAEPAEPTAEPTEPTAEPTEPTAEPTEPTAEPSPEPSAEPSPEPSEDPDAGIMLLMSEPPASTGEISLSIANVVNMGTWAPVFTVQLADTTDPSGLSTRRVEVPMGSTHKFEDLPAALDVGTVYDMTVTAPGFVPFTQSFTVTQSGGLSVRLEVGRMSYGGNHPGVLLMGDVNSDGKLDGDDSRAMMDAVARGLTASAGLSENGYTDLNGDNMTTLADAEQLAKNMALASQPDAIAATAELYIPLKSIQAGTTSDVVSSNLDDLLQDNGVMTTLSRADGFPIDENNPVDVVFQLGEGAQAEEIIVEGSNITAGQVEIVYDVNGEPVTAWGLIAPEGVQGISLFELEGAPTVTVKRDSSGNIVVDLGGQVAVKRVSFKITATTSENPKLAEISQVEFLNGMESRIQEPAKDIPEGVVAVGGNEEFTVTWQPCVNITGYEVSISDGTAEEIIPLTGTSLTVTRFNNDDVVNYTTYTVKVRSVNGMWSSDWSETATAVPAPSGKPDKPDNVTATGGFESVTVSWKKMKSTKWYNLYYKEESEEAYTKIPNLETTSYVITGLDSTKPTTYVVYVTGENDWGESDQSLPAGATTVTMIPPDMPKYNLINQSGNVPGSAHISAAACNAGAGCYNNATDQANPGSAWCTVDGDPFSYYERLTWDDGGFNNLGTDIGLTYTFDGTYTMDTIGIMVPTGMAIGYAKVRWWDAAGEPHVTNQGVVGVQSRQDGQGIGYYFLRLPGPITTNKIQIGLSRGWVKPESVSVSEVYFYKYDPLKEELMALYTDDLHTTIRDDVTEEMLNDLERRINEAQDEYGNVNPDKDLLLKELETARAILEAQKLSRITRVHDGITASGDEHGFGGLNAWQPLGVVAAAGDKLTVYVSHNYLTTGTNTNLELIVTQYHAEANGLSATVQQKLKVGPNEVTIPKFSSAKPGIEAGGALYVQYNGGAGSGDSYAVRVVGGVQVPMLDLYKVPEGEKLGRVQAYLSELGSFVSGIADLHAEQHQGGETPNANVNYDYDEYNCILGSSDIMMDTMMLSIPAQQIMAGSGGDAQTLLTSLNAMEDMMYLFYQHKGLNAAAPNALDQIPKRHLNIRYMRMFSGAFMYASGNHIGIEWPETKGLTNCQGVTATDDGLWQSGNYFGWGIAHEIGHDINQGTYAIAEITNNYFAVLAQAKDDNDSVRFKYEDVYSKVTSGTKGRASNVFTQLGMYWQLHLAYDTGYNFKTYSNYSEQLQNLFWARVDTYARRPSQAPKTAIPLSLEGVDGEQALMRLCCAAANRNILEFFERWGKTPDEGTIAYAEQFAKETRAIWYVSDNSRRYTKGHGEGSSMQPDCSTKAVGEVNVAVDPNKANKVDITIGASPVVNAEAVLGYEIVRCTISGGVTEKKTVGFTTTNTFSDVVYAMNNRAVSYEVILVDQFLNRSAVKSTGMVKIQHEGDLDKAHWSVTTTCLTADPIPTDPTEQDPDAAERDPALLDSSAYMVDGKVETVYNGTVAAPKEGEAASDPAIEIDFHETQVITGFRYTAGDGSPIGTYTAEVRQNGEWTPVQSGALGAGKTVYFDNADRKYVSTYAADAIRLTLTGMTAGQSVSVAELDVLGLSGDNVEFRSAEGTGEVAIGKLSADYVYDKETGAKIPADSLVFTGLYKGNAGYNVVVLYDQNGNMVTGYDEKGQALVANQIIIAPDPKEGMIEDTTDGTWVYWIEPQYMGANFVKPTQVRAELYRVNNATTSEGQRLVSDTLFVDVPETLGYITLDANG